MKEFLKFHKCKDKDKVKDPITLMVLGAASNII